MNITRSLYIRGGKNITRRMYMNSKPVNEIRSSIYPTP
jgi:hypothetical protein